MIAPALTGSQHMLPVAEGGTPFTIGKIDPSKGYIHVLDDTTLDILLRTLDTVSDFVSYLTRKERLIDSGRLVFAAGEEDLLAFYLTYVNDDQEHDFVLPPDLTGVSIDEGFWENFIENPQRKAQIDANKISYAWDHLIESFSGHIRAGTLHSGSEIAVAEHEKLQRLLAREPRTLRRFLTKRLMELIEKTGESLRGARVVIPSKPNDPLYVFLLLRQPQGVDYDEYRKARETLLHAYCLVAKLEWPSAQDIVGIATGIELGEGGSEDAIYLDGREWPPEMESEARRLQNEHGILQQKAMSSGTEYEYPPKPDDG